MLLPDDLLLALWWWLTTWIANHLFGASFRPPYSVGDTIFLLVLGGVILVAIGLVFRLVVAGAEARQRFKEEAERQQAKAEREAENDRNDRV